MSSLVSSGQLPGEDVLTVGTATSVEAVEVVKSVEMVGLVDCCKPVFLF